MRSGRISLIFSDSWTMKQAGSSFSKLFNASFEKPQVISSSDGHKVVMLSEQEYNALVNKPASLVETLQSMQHAPVLATSLQEPAPYQDLNLN